MLSWSRATHAEPDKEKMKDDVKFEETVALEHNKDGNEMGRS